MFILTSNLEFYEKVFFYKIEFQVLLKIFFLPEGLPGIIPVSPWASPPLGSKQLKSYDVTDEYQTTIPSFFPVAISTGYS